MASRADNCKAKATRHIFLIRHSQYHVDASRDKDRTLTPLGMWLASLDPHQGPLAQIQGLSLCNYPPLTQDRL